MAHGLPVIATPRCGTVVQPGKTGWITDPGNPEQLAGVFLDALSAPETLTQMSAAAIARIEQFSIGRLGASLARLGQLLGYREAHD
jgi:glycosyltransferase involved in cell wall biosynthesis